MMTLDEAVKKVRPLDEKAMEGARKRWDSIAKPLHSLGELENMLTQIAGITGTPEVRVEKKAVVAMCADNGVVEEGVTQTGQEVTAVVAENFLEGTTTCCVMCRQCGAELFPVDVGMVTDTKVRTDLKVAYGTRNMTREPAMTRDQAIRGIEAGIAMAEELKEKGYQVLATGEMGIGNTTTSSAMAAVFLGRSPREVTGYGAGLSGEGLRRKIAVIDRALKLNQPDAADPLDVLAKVGGLDIAGLTGLFLGGARYQMPVLIDGFISSVAAYCAWKLCPAARDAMIATHCSGEPAGKWMLEALGLEPFLYADMRMGEGTGAAVAYPVLQAGFAEYTQLPTFAGGSAKAYEHIQ